MYLTIFPPLLSPAFWERPANVPPLVRLLQAYLAKAGPQVVAGGHLPPLLGVFQKLLSSKAHDHEGARPCHQQPAPARCVCRALHAQPGVAARARCCAI